MKSFLDAIVRSSAPSFVLSNDRSNRILADALVTAFDSASRRRGLLHHDSLPEGSGLIIAPSSAIHTFFMRFPIDVVFVSKAGRVLKVRTRMPAWRIAGAWRGYAVVELPVGAIDRSDTRRGDILRVG